MITGLVGPLHGPGKPVIGCRHVVRAKFMSAWMPVDGDQCAGHPENLQANYPDAEHSFPPPAREVAYKFLDEHLKKGR